MQESFGKQSDFPNPALEWERSRLNFLRRLWKRRCARVLLSVLCFALLAAVLFGSAAWILSAGLCQKEADRILSMEALSEMEGEFESVLVLGCKVYADGRMSDMLADRVQIGITLFQRLPCKALIMSGDRHTGYDEVGAMQDAALAAGIDPDAVFSDPAGFSTYESIFNLRSSYQGGRVLIVTQEYHLYRALYVAEKMGIDAYGVSADLRPYSGQFKRDVREVLARVKDIWFVQAEKESFCSE